MTAEISIMNRNGIALASDSAVTVRINNNKKIYDTANKLFTLSKYYPIGVMFFGNAKFMNVPWETVIKIFREQLGSKSCNSLREYASMFINFLESENFIPQKQQKSEYLSLVFSYFNMIKQNINNKVKSEIKESNITDNHLKNIISKEINEEHKKLSSINYLSNLNRKEGKKLEQDFKKEIGDIKEKVFEKLPITDDDFSKLKSIAVNLFIKDIFFDYSGVVIAGFGEEEIFPSLILYNIGYLVNNKLKYKKVKEQKIDFDNSATIIPFAQKEMVYTFMEGIDEYQIETINEYLKGIFYRDYPEKLCNNFDDIGKNDIKALRKIGKAIIDEFNEKMSEYRKANYVNKIINAVEFLPKDKLAEMAESLVYLTSFKRSVSMDEETVGGPIDVAVITKGDGFIWIKRKHYFKPELNHHFFENYYSKFEKERRSKNDIDVQKRRRKRPNV